MIPTQLLNHLWQSTLFAVTAGLLTLALRKNRAPVRYWLWFAASAKFLVPFSLLVTIGSQVEWRKAQAVHPSAIPFVMEQISQPFTPPPQSPIAAKKPSVSIRTVLLSVWLGGLSVVVFSWFRQWRRIRTAIRVASPLHLNLPIRAMSSPARLEPGVFGIFRPVLLVPEGITDRLTPAQWEAILAHELCHVRRRDNLTAAIHMAVEALFWFHPLAWWIGKRLVDERERACDEEVLSLGSEPQVYAEGILNVCKLYVESPLVCVSGVTGSDLKKRIRAIMTERVARDLNFAKKVALAVAGVAVVLVPIAVGIMNPPIIRAQSAAAAVPKFAVASIRPHQGPVSRIGLSISGTLVTVVAYSVSDLITDGYGVKDYQVDGAKGWISSDRYDIVARSEGESAPTRDQASQMLQALLTDRFQLKIHRETKEMPAYALVIGKNGPKLKENTTGTPMWRMSGKGLDTQTTFTSSPIESLVTQLSHIPGVGRPVLDKTSLTGRYDFQLNLTRNLTDSSVTGSQGESVFTAIEEQLGLRLESQKAPIGILVIDHVERPSDN